MISLPVAVLIAFLFALVYALILSTEAGERLSIDPETRPLPTAFGIAVVLAIAWTVDQNAARTVAVLFIPAGVVFGLRSFWRREARIRREARTRTLHRSFLEGRNERN